MKNRHEPTQIVQRGNLTNCIIQHYASAISTKNDPRQACHSQRFGRTRPIDLQHSTKPCYPEHLNGYKNASASHCVMSKTNMKHASQETTSPLANQDKYHFRMPSYTNTTLIYIYASSRMKTNDNPIYTSYSYLLVQAAREPQHRYTPIRLGRKATPAHARSSYNAML